MNYIAQINAFWEKFNQLPDGKPYHIAVYFALLHINNQTGWKTSFRVNYQTILDLTNVSPKTYYKSCDWLYQKGFLAHYRKGRNQYESALFSLKVLYQNYQSTGKASNEHGKSRDNILKIEKQENYLNKIRQDTLDEIFRFFESRGLDKQEAQKFINYNQSRGWRGITDWQPIAENWILNLNKNSKTKSHGTKQNIEKLRKRFSQKDQDYTSYFQP